MKAARPVRRRGPGNRPIETSARRPGPTYLANQRLDEVRRRVHGSGEYVAEGLGGEGLGLAGELPGNVRQERVTVVSGHKSPPLPTLADSLAVPPVASDVSASHIGLGREYYGQPLGVPLTSTLQLVTGGPCPEPRSEHTARVAVRVSLLAGTIGGVSETITLPVLVEDLAPVMRGQETVEPEYGRKGGQVGRRV